MKCEEMENLTALYVGGELNVEERSTVENHINNCDACKKEVTEYRAISTALSELREGDIPDGVWEDMWLDIRDRVHRQKHALIFDNVLRVAASLLIGIGVGFFGYILTGDRHNEVSDLTVVDKGGEYNSTPLVDTAHPRTNIYKDASLGLTAEGIDDVLRSHLKLSKDMGMHIAEVVKNGLAENIGLKPHDILVGLNDHPVNNIDALKEMLKDRRTNIYMRVTIIRNGERKDIVIDNTKKDNLENK